MGVGIQGERCPAVTQDARECLGVHAAGQRMGRERVSEVVKSDAGQAGVFQQYLQSAVGGAGIDG